MSLGLYDADRRYRRRVRGATLRVGFYLATLAGVGLFSHQIGVEQVESRERQLQETISTLQEQNRTLEESTAQAQAQAQTLRTQYQELESRFEQEVPTGAIRELSTRVAARLDEGLDADRLEFYINAAGEARDCSAPETRRFIMPTPAYQGANTSVRFADGRITVTGMGESGVNAGGQPQAWFDPAEDLTVSFTTVGGDETTVEGRLPLHHSVVLEDREFRFTVDEHDERSFVEVTSDNCPFP